MTVEKCPNANCGKLFSVSQIGTNVPGGRESEPITCPHCGYEARTERTSGVFRTHPATPEQEEEWKTKGDSTE